MTEKVQPGVYKHYKGGKYRVIGIGVERDTLEKRVVYEMLFDGEDFPKGTIWLKSEEDFTGYVDIDGKKVKRFEKVH